jgi:hypothetical protein
MTKMMRTNLENGRAARGAKKIPQAGETPRLDAGALELDFGAHEERERTAASAR